MAVSLQATLDHTIAVSHSCGVARQYRVQIETGASLWRKYASFHSREQAEDCLKSLSEDGYRARLVTYDLPPTA